MKTLTDFQIIRGSDGNPAFAVVPYQDLMRLLYPVDTENGVPSAVADLALDNAWSAVRAWREHLGLGEDEVAARLGITPSAYHRYEHADTLPLNVRADIAAALGIHAEQLDF